jgi:hypothetical protein
MFLVARVCLLAQFVGFHALQAVCEDKLMVAQWHPDDLFRLARLVLRAKYGAPGALPGCVVIPKRSARACYDHQLCVTVFGDDSKMQQGNGIIGWMEWEACLLHNVYSSVVSLHEGRTLTPLTELRSSLSRLAVALLSIRQNSGGELCRCPRCCRSLALLNTTIAAMPRLLCTLQQRESEHVPIVQEVFLRVHMPEDIVAIVEAYLWPDVKASFARKIRSRR